MCLWVLHWKTTILGVAGGLIVASATILVLYYFKYKSKVMRMSEQAIGMSAVYSSVPLTKSDLLQQ